MKRSEMIEKLANIIYNAQGEFGEPDRSVANEVLNELEKLGMLPPYIPTNLSGWEIGKGGSAYINKWEPENET